jgi:dTDP-4-dehydrorhamnose reductase
MLDGLLLGTGQLACALSQQMSLYGFRMLQVPRHVFPLGDCLQFESLCMRVRPAIIINAAAYTDVEQAEREPDVAMAVNRVGPQYLARLARDYNALLVHFSTDYVFDGSGEHPWCEEDTPAPLNMYGLSKWQGEQAIIESSCRYLIIRTSWLHSPWRKNFLTTMLQLGLECEFLTVVCDQVGAPTSANMLASATFSAIQKILINPSLCGVYHIVASGAVSWFDYATYLFDEARALGMLIRVRDVRPVFSRDYPTLALRPLNSRLSTQKACATFGIVLPDWQYGVRDSLIKIDYDKKKPGDVS